MADINEEDIHLDDQQLDTVVDNLLQIGAEDVAEEKTRPTLESLKEAAQTFFYTAAYTVNYLQTMQLVLEKIKSSIQVMLTQDDIKEASNYVKLQQELKDIEETEILQRCFNEAEFFKNMVNNFIGQTIQMVYINEDTEGNIAFYQIPNIDFLKFRTISGTIRTEFLYEKEELDNHLQKIYVNSDPKGVKGLQEVYQEIHTRMQGKTKKNSKNYKYLLWLNVTPPPKWLKIYYNSGNVKEAYMDVIFTHHENIFNNSFDKDTNIHLFVINFLSQVDNISGTLEEDIEFNNIYYGGKSIGASYMALNNLIRIAKEIMEKNITPEDITNIKNELHNQGHQSNNIKGRVGNYIKSISVNSLKEKLQQINNGEYSTYVVI